MTEVKNAKSGGKEQEELAKIIEKKYQDKIDKVIVHSMPKKYVNVEVKTKNAKNTGIIIFIGGLILLAAVFAGLYYILFVKNPFAPATPNISEQPVVKEEIATTTEESEPVKEDIKEEINEEKNYEEEIATTTEEATSTLTLELNELSSTTPATTTIEETPKSEITYKDALDTDNDGLSDMEEIIFDTNIEVLDSDNDSYSDLSEILNLYNPNGNGKLETNENIKLYQNTKLSYSLLCPASWLSSPMGDESSIMLKAGNNQFMQIMVLDNENNLTLEGYYMTQYDTDTISENQNYTSQNGWRGIKSKGGYDLYITHPGLDKFILVTYNLGLDNVLYYKNIYEMIIKSLKFGQ